ncbi:hypothetical protein [Enhygromyxa salina]|uniref:Uncharacterized protein n=1 Tax=Enhygromyxa salina TaxID=215803 RepID=A0A2S9YNE8_9BACT|nr:hypothetical protein [Enhygromyxa salina]PRQ06579.1 hypothetical protein ENSA7_37320 [Enhygromyxa salina]
MWRSAVLLASLLGCGDELRPPSYIEVTEIFTIRHEVELGPLNPERVGPLIAGPEAPIADVLPGDRLRLEAVVVDPQGVLVPEHELETLWLACGGSCVSHTGQLDLAHEVFDQRCDTLENYTTDDPCLLGTGSGAFEFEVPELGERVFIRAALNPRYRFPSLQLIAVVAWDGRRATDCWESRRGDLSNLEGCGFIHHKVSLGPLWFLYAYGAQMGLSVPFEADPATLPPQLFLQPANRIPRTPTVSVSVDGELLATGVPPLAPIPVRAGAMIEVQLSFDQLSQLFQSRLVLLKDKAGSAFTLRSESLYSRTATSGAIVQSGNLEPVEDDGSFSYQVDAQLEPGISRVLIGYTDDGLANDVLTLEFEHQ